MRGVIDARCDVAPASRRRFTMPGDRTNRRRDAGPTKNIHSLPARWLTFHRSELWREMSAKSSEEVEQFPCELSPTEPRCYSQNYERCSHSRIGGRFPGGAAPGA